MSEQRQHRKCDTCVLILGAGFSAPWGAPVMAHFMNKAQFQYFNHVAAKNPLAEHYRHMLDFRRECQSSSWRFNRDWDNIEELYTQADLLRLAYGGRNLDGTELTANALCRHIAWAIWDVYRIGKVEDPPSLGGFIDRIRVALGLHAAIITTNYDVLCEVGATRVVVSSQKSPQCFYPGFREHVIQVGQERVLEHCDDNLFTSRVDKQLVPIIKLHGSVNWFEASKSSEPEPNAGWFALESFGAYEKKPFGLNDPSFAIAEVRRQLSGCGVIGEPCAAIVPPMLGKSAVHPAIAAQWRAAVESLERAKRVYIVGYSFPETDVFMIRLLTEGLKRNEGLEEITIVNQSELTVEWGSKLKRFFTPVVLAKTLRYLCLGSDAFIGYGAGDTNFFDSIKGEMVHVV
jgi:hypothetical protein